MYHVYIIQHGRKGAFKIGIARNVEKRIVDLQIGTPVELRIIAKFDFGSKKNAYRVEQKLHRIFRKYWIRGEWFSNKIRLQWADEILRTDFEKQKAEYFDNEQRIDIEISLDIDLLASLPERF